MKNYSACWCWWDSDLFASSLIKAKKALKICWKMAQTLFFCWLLLVGSVKTQPAFCWVVIMAFFFLHSSWNCLVLTCQSRLYTNQILSGLVCCETVTHYPDLQKPPEDRSGNGGSQKIRTEKVISKHKDAHLRAFCETKTNKLSFNWRA